MQPWKVHVVLGDVKAGLQAELVAAFHDPNCPEDAEYDYYPPRWWEPYTARRRKVGWNLYGLLGIARRDVAAMRRQHARNFMFFGAPVGLFFTIERKLTSGSWLDAGMFMQNVMTAARAQGLHTCPQAAFTPYHRIIRRHLSIPEDEILLCGMSLGYEDKTKPENVLRTEREPLERFAFFHGG
jgi:nitroreductase